MQVKTEYILQEIQNYIQQYEIGLLNNALAGNLSRMDELNIAKLEKLAAAVFRTELARGGRLIMNQEIRDLYMVTINAMKGAKYAYNKDHIYEMAQQAIKGEQRTELVKMYVNECVNRGLAFMPDRGGRNWSVYRYIDTALRNSVAVTNRLTEDQLADELGLDVIFIVPHLGSRPLCEPYQNKYWSMSGKTGTMQMANGETIQYGSIYDTSYGEMAGLFGINCRHTYYYVQEGQPTPHYKNIDKSQNDQLYRLQQKQNILESNIRKIKIKNEIYKQQGIPTEPIRELQTSYKAFCKKYNLPVRNWKTSVK